MTGRETTFAVWQSTMCPSYLLHLRKIARFLSLNGWREVPDMDAAEVVLVGACAGFLASFDMFRERMGPLRGAGRRVVVYGCLPKVDPAFYAAEAPPDVITIPSRHPERAEGLVDEVTVPFADLPDESAFRPEDTADPDPTRRYVVVQEGCTEHCAYCPHKIGIGSAASRPLEDIVALVERDAAAGARSYYIDGNDSGSWGVDMAPPRAFPELVDALLAAAPQAQLQFGNIAPKWFRVYGQTLADALTHPRITNVKVPIQTTSERLLRLMRRDPFVRGLSPFLSRMRGGNPALRLRTDIIVGLPTETTAELADTLAFVAEHFHRVAVHRFDLHPRTLVARMQIPHLTAEEQDERMRMALAFFAEHPQVDARFDAWDRCALREGGA